MESDKLFLPNKPSSGTIPVAFGDIQQNKRVNNLPPLPADFSHWEGKYSLDCGGDGDGEWIVSAGYDPAVSGELEQQWIILRHERDQRLAETDKAMLVDNPMALTNTQLATLTAYRADLRNLPSGTGDPTAPTWPALTTAILDKLKI